MRKILAFFITVVMLVGLVAPIHTVQAQTPYTDWEYAKNLSLDWVRDAVVPNPFVGSVGGEWAVLALARAGRVTVDDPWVAAWLRDIERNLAEIDSIIAANPGIDISHPPSVGTFPSEMRRWTDFQRVTLALSALGLDASNLNGRDLTAVYATFVPPNERHALNTTINVDTFALIALDAAAYDGDRDLFIQSMLYGQRADGSWSLNPALPSSSFDLDVTAMALQALAPYYRNNDPRVTEAVNRALTWLRAQTFGDSESTTQMIVALTALGPDFADEAAYYVAWLLRWFDPASGGFRRPGPTDPVNHMATEQAAYALVAYWRFVNGMTHLYDMSDMFDGEQAYEPTVQIDTTGLPGRHADINVVETVSPGRTFADIQNHANQEAIETLAQRGIINGRTETAFAPDETMTRAEFAAIITRGLGLPSRNPAMFEDVASGAWYALAVGTAFYYEIVSGTSATTFNPSGTITRQEAAVMVARAARLAGLDTSLSHTETLNILAMFGDYRTAADWAWEALAFCYREGILDDYEFYIQPNAAISRGEIAEMLHRLLDRAGLYA